MLTIIDVKETLANSLIELTYQKPINKITVKDIVEHCNTARQTFYNHFNDKYDLINWIYKNKSEEVLTAFNETSNWYECMKKSYSIFLQNKHFFTKVINLSGQNSFVEFFYEHTKSYFINSIISRYGKDALTESLLYSIDFNSYGQVHMCLKWIREGMKESPELMAKYNLENIPKNLIRYFI